MKFLTQLALLPLALAAPILESRQDAQLIPNKWIVVLRDDADDNILSSTVQAVTDALAGHPLTVSTTWQASRASP